MLEENKGEKMSECKLCELSLLKSFGLGFLYDPNANSIYILMVCFGFTIDFTKRSGFGFTNEWSKKC